MQWLQLKFLLENGFIFANLAKIGLLCCADGDRVTVTDLNSTNGKFENFHNGPVIAPIFRIDQITAKLAAEDT